MGLSPRVRGNRASACVGSLTSGSIPACAGEPRFGLRGFVDFRVYPRVCGGTIVYRAGVGLRLGLSPRVRGNPLIPAEVSSTSWVYPRVCGGTACGGKSFRPPRGRRVYPRVCGGTSDKSRTTDNPAGLSPRVRGNRRSRQPQRSLSVAQTGSIPACAGEPRSRRASEPRGRWPTGLSPRVRGNRDLSSVCRACFAWRDLDARGLSPRVRGNPDHAYKGSIPACAGEPHGSGWPGLSPRVRGNHGSRACRRRSSIRVYPRVCGGTLARAGRRTDHVRVYPRVCGGTTATPDFPAGARGLSPRVRGNPDGGSTWHRKGSIPACAGEPP